VYSASTHRISITYNCIIVSCFCVYLFIFPSTSLFMVKKFVVSVLHPQIQDVNVTLLCSNKYIFLRFFVRFLLSRANYNFVSLVVIRSPRESDITDIQYSTQKPFDIWPGDHTHKSSTSIIGRGVRCGCLYMRSS